MHFRNLLERIAAACGNLPTWAAAAPSPSRFACHLSPTAWGRGTAGQLSDIFSASAGGAPGTTANRVLIAKPQGVPDHPAGSALIQPLCQLDGDGVARLLADGIEQVGLDRQLVGAVAESHEGTLEGYAIGGRPHLHQAPCSEEICGTGPDHIGPAALRGALLNRGIEGFVEWSLHRRSPGWLHINDA